MVSGCSRSVMSHAKERRLGLQAAVSPGRSYTKRQGSVVLVAVDRPVTSVCLTRTTFVMTWRAAHRHKSNLEKTVQAAVREFYIFDRMLQRRHGMRSKRRR